MKKLKNFSGKLLGNKKGQGATEYILLLVVIVALGVAFKDRITTAFNSKLSSVGTSLEGF